MINIFHPLDDSKIIGTLEYADNNRILFRELDPETGLEVLRSETNPIPKRPIEITIAINVLLNGLDAPGQVNIYGDGKLIQNRSIPTDWLVKYNFTNKAVYSLTRNFS